MLATENVVKLCLDESVKRLVHCSTAEVTVQPYYLGGITDMQVYSREWQTLPPKNTKRLIFGEYAASKLRAEDYVLKANGTPLQNGI